MEQEFTSMQEYVANHYQVQTHTSDEVFIDYNFPAAHERYDMGHFYEGKDPESLPVYSSPSPTYDGDKAEEPVDLDLDLLEQGYSDAPMNFDMDMIVRNMEVENVKPVEKKKKIFKILHDTVSTADSDCGQSSPDLSLIQVKVKRGRKSTKNYAESPAEDEEFICEEKLHKKSKQNPRRNGPGLIVKRVRTGLILLFDHDKKKGLDDEEFQRLEYMTKMVKAFEMNDAELAGFERFIREFSLQAKTWSNIEGNLKKNSNFAKVFLAVIERFLSKEGEADFQDWLENGKLRSGKDAITENKGWFKAEFGKRIGSFSK